MVERFVNILISVFRENMWWLMEQLNSSTMLNFSFYNYTWYIFLLFFQNSLSVLSTNVIQQFLDELTFREVLGKTSLQSFDGLISRIASQTSYVCKRNATMSTRLRTVADNPFGDWRMTFSSVPVIDGKDWKEFTALLAVFETLLSAFETFLRRPRILFIFFLNYSDHVRFLFMIG